MSGETIKALITTGTIVEIDTPLGTKLPITYSGDGQIAGQAPGLGWYLGASQDNGRWWVQSDMLCHKWQKWFSGETQCMRLSREGARIHWRSRDGNTGTATYKAGAVVAAAPAVKPPSVAEAPPAAAVARAAAVPVEVAKLERSADVPRVEVQPQSMVRLGRTPTTEAVPKVAVPVRQVAKAAPRAAVAEKAPTEPAPAPNPALFKVVRVESDDVLNVRRGPSAEHDVVGVIPPRGNGVEMTGACREQWCPVRHQKLHGWVNRLYLESESGAVPTKVVAGSDNPDAPRACLSSAARELLARIEAQFGAMRLVSTCRRGARIAGTGRVSRHSSGNAIDFDAGPKKAAVIAWLLANHRSGGIMTYPGMDHIHVDIGPHFVSLAGARVRQ